MSTKLKNDNDPARRFLTYTEGRKYQKVISLKQNNDGKRNFGFIILNLA